MSWYYNYYLGYEKDGKVYPLGPFDSTGQYHSVHSVSSSFASDMHERFWQLPNEKITDELEKAFGYNIKDHGPYECGVCYLPFESLPSGSFIKSGYYLIEDVECYQNDGDVGNLFYDKLTPEVFAAKLVNESRLGAPGKRLDAAGEEYIPHSVGDYMYFAYPDYSCEEYEAFLLRNAAEPYMYTDVLKGDDVKIIVLMTQG